MIRSILPTLYHSMPALPIRLHVLGGISIRCRVQTSSLCGYLFSLPVYLCIIPVICYIRGGHRIGVQWFRYLSMKLASLPVRPTHILQIEGRGTKKQETKSEIKLLILWSLTFVEIVLRSLISASQKSCIFSITKLIRY